MTQHPVATQHGNLLAPPTRLPVDPAVALLSSGTAAADVAAQYPASSAAWAALASDALAGGRVVEAYAYARTGYHRGLDALRRAGWRGQGAVPWEHEPNQGFLRALHALAVTSGELGESDEAKRCSTLLADSSPTAVTALASS